MTDKFNSLTSKQQTVVKLFFRFLREEQPHIYSFLLKLPQMEKERLIHSFKIRLYFSYVRIVAAEFKMREELLFQLENRWKTIMRRYEEAIAPPREYTFDMNELINKYGIYGTNSSTCSSWDVTYTSNLNDMWTYII